MGSILKKEGTIDNLEFNLRLAYELAKTRRTVERDLDAKSRTLTPLPDNRLTEAAPKTSEGQRK
jgi:hypothetical protein